MQILPDADRTVQRQFTAADARRSGFIPVPLAALREYGQASQTLGALLSIFRQDGKTTFRRQDILTKSAGVPLRTLQRHLATLEAAGLIKRTKRQSDHQSDVLSLGRPESELLESGFLPLPRYTCTLPFSERIVYAWIIYRAEISPAGDTCTDSFAAIAKGVGITRRAVINAIGKLAASGFVQRAADLPGDAGETVLCDPQQGSEKMAGRHQLGSEKMAGRLVKKWRGGSEKMAGHVLEEEEYNKKPDKKRLVLDFVLANDEATKIAVELARFRGRTWPALQTLGLEAAGVIACLIARHRGLVSASIANYAVGLLIRMADEPKDNPIGWTIADLRDFSPEAAGQVQRLLPISKRAIATLIADAAKLRVRVCCEECDRTHEPLRRDRQGMPVCSDACQVVANARIDAQRRQDRFCVAAERP